MPSGDAQRAWFPEMIRTLSVAWSEDLNWDDCIKLCERLTKDRVKIKKHMGIRDARMKCRDCGEVHEMEPLPIGIRSMLFALKREGVIDESTFKSKDLEWKRYMREHKVDFKGDPKAKQNPEANF